MNKWLLGSAMGMMAGVGLMMTPMARTIRKDVRMGMNKARKMMRQMNLK